jgi:hypothetical protein
MILSRAALILLLSAILFLFLSQFFFSTRFTFDDSPSPFSGNLIYNPYDSLNSEKWVKSNFHAHAKAWKGVTNGHGTAADIHRVYDSLGYGIHSVSNYHNIDTASFANSGYISAYEHGYNLMKTHQLVLGGNKVLWLDYILPQTRNNKQDIINALSPDTNSVVILNHPALRNGYTQEDLLYLTNYDCMEVLSPSAIASEQWDATLSAGKAVFIVGNDDEHNILKKERVGRICTFVNVEERKKENVLKALKTGKSYGMIIGPGQDPFSLPELQSLQVNNDTIVLQLGAEAKKISLFGQNGRLIASYAQTDYARYALKVADHYARAVIDFENGTRMFLNPVFFTNSVVLSQSTVDINHLETAGFRLLGIGIIVIWFNWAWSFVWGRKRIASRGKFSFPVIPKYFFPGNLPKRKKRDIAL